MSGRILLNPRGEGPSGMQTSFLKDILPLALGLVEETIRVLPRLGTRYLCQVPNLWELALCTLKKEKVGAL